MKTEFKVGDLLVYREGKQVIYVSKIERKSQRTHILILSPLNEREGETMSMCGAWYINTIEQYISERNIIHYQVPSENK